MREREIFIKALYSDCEIHCNTDYEIAKLTEIFEAMPYKVKDLKCKNFGPDILIETETLIYGIEHFEVDGSKNNDKGSHYKRESHHINVKCERLLEQQLIESGTSIAIVRGEYDTKFTYKDFFNNFKRHFIKHYKKVASYRSNLRTYEQENHELYFFVEDVTPIRSFIDEDDNESSVQLLNDIHFYNILQTCPHLVGIFFLDKSNINGKIVDRLTFLLNTPENISELKKLKEHKLFNGYQTNKEMETLKYIDIIIESDVE